jgi:hypothetical protein
MWNRRPFQDEELQKWIIAEKNPLVVFPFPVSGNYIDQAAGGLMFLGDPFFYHHKPKEICRVRPVNMKHMQSIINHERMAILENTSTGKEWLQTEHIQFLLSWFFRDTDHPILNEFHVVPLDITTTLGSFFDMKLDGEVLARSVHKYCSKNYKALHKRFIFLCKI